MATDVARPFVADEASDVADDVGGGEGEVGVSIEAQPPVDGVVEHHGPWIPVLSKLPIRVNDWGWDINLKNDQAKMKQDYQTDNSTTHFIIRFFLG